MEAYSPRKWLSFINQENEEIKDADFWNIEGKLMEIGLFSVVWFFKKLSLERLNC